MNPQTASCQFNRREHERFVLPPMYSPVTVRRARGMAAQALDGHAYDVSESGIRLEVDVPLEVGEVVRVSLELPGYGGEVTVWAEVVRVYDEEDDPAARRAALRFRNFATPADQARLMLHLGTGALRRAA